jgi:hypothetical protein
LRMRADWTGNVADEPLLFKRSVSWKPMKAIDPVTRVRALPSFSPLRRTDLSAPRRPLRWVRMSVHCSTGRGYRLLTAGTVDELHGTQDEEPLTEGGWGRRRTPVIHCGRATRPVRW